MIVDGRKTELIVDNEDNEVFCSNGNYALSYCLDYPTLYALGENELNRIQTDWNRCFEMLPTGTVVVKSDIFLNNFVRGEELPRTTFLERAFSDHFNGRKYTRRTSYLFFVWTGRTGGGVFNGRELKNPFKFPSLKDFDRQDTALRAFKEAVKNVISLFAGSRIKIHPLREHQIREYRRFYFNGFQWDYTGDLTAGKDHFSFDGKKIGVLCLDSEESFPDMVSPCIQDKQYSSVEYGFTFFTGLMDDAGMKFNYPHIANQIVFIDEHNAHTKRIAKNLNELKTARKWGANQLNYDVLKNNFEEIGGDTNLHLSRGHFNIIFWAETAGELDHRKSTLVGLMRNKDFVLNYPTGENLKSVFYNSFFTNASCFSDNQLYIADLKVASSLLINAGNYNSDKDGIYLQDRLFNVPVRFDFWDKQKKNIQSRNFSVIAPTGRGKSFTCNFLFRQLLEQDISIVIIDLGESYTKFATLFPKEMVEVFKYKDGEPLGLNPFLLDANEKVDSRKLGELSAFIWTLIKKDNEPTENERTALRKIIVQYYEVTLENHQVYHSWDNFYDYIKNNKKHLFLLLEIEPQFFDLEEFLHAGSEFCKGGTYGNLLQKSDNLQNFKGKKLIIFELDNIQNDKLLLSVILQVISEAIQKVIWADRENKGIVFFDEFAKQLEFGNVFRSVKYYMETIRKFEGSCGIVLQTINQLPDTQTGNTIVDNIQTKIFLEADDYRANIERLNLSSHTASQLKSLRSKHTGDGYKYSEIYINRNNVDNVYRVEVSRAEFLAFQTEGDIHTKLWREYERNGNMEETILKYIADEKKIVLISFLCFISNILFGQVSSPVQIVNDPTNLAKIKEMVESGEKTVGLMNRQLKYIEDAKEQLVKVSSYVKTARSTRRALERAKSLATTITQAQDDLIKLDLDAKTMDSYSADMKAIYSSSLEIVEELATVLTDGSLNMSDAERLNIIRQQDQELSFKETLLKRRVDSAKRLASRKATLKALSGGN